MKKIFFVVISIILIACSNESISSEKKQLAVSDNKSDSVYQENFMFVGSQDTVVKNGELITRYKNGVIDKQGMMKDGKRDGLWKSFYEDGTPWSETTFKDGIKNGKTTTFYPNGQKRYEGFYTNDTESGKWIYYDELGKQIQLVDYDKK